MTRTSPAATEDGYTLVEVLVAIALFLILTTAILTTAVLLSQTTNNVRQFTNINEQARIATERISREMRQAMEVRGATIPATTGGDTDVTFGVDFNGNQVIDTTAADPEVITYRYDSANERLTLTGNDEDGNLITRPILSEDVTGFEFTFRSSLWQYDGNLNGVKDGVTDWRELDATQGVGNLNGILDEPELDRIDLIGFTLTLMDGKHKQTYQTQVTLRNMAQN